jgi:lipopolysaccharide transport system ATP-binding protein
LTETAIHVSELSKQYHIGKREKYRTLRESLMDMVTSPIKKINSVIGGHGASGKSERMWALKGIDLDVERGEVLGIIGRNGAGKSTLLKILSRITEPTEGFAEIRGRVGSLLEVGTGFHPELTGRENIYLNGAILGMNRAEIEDKFDEIVAFAEVEKFIDTAVKHYSSGMYLRLAFAVAAHLEPEILIVDEVLAVGDARFQKKCLAKMQDVGQKGRTVLFVSHNMPAVLRLCQRVVLLEEGRVVADGSPHNVVRQYLSAGTNTPALREWLDPAKAPGGETARLRAVRICTEQGKITDQIDIREPFRVEMEYEVLKSGSVLLPHYFFWNEDEVCIFGSLDIDPIWQGKPRPAGRYVSAVKIPGNLLAEGTIYVNAALNTMNPFRAQFWEKSAVAFQVVENNESGETARGEYTGRIQGAVRPLLQWTTKYQPSVEMDLHG